MPFSGCSSLHGMNPNSQLNIYISVCVCVCVCARVCVFNNIIQSLQSAQLAEHNIAGLIRSQFFICMLL